MDYLIRFMADFLLFINKNMAPNYTYDGKPLTSLSNDVFTQVAGVGNAGYAGLQTGQWGNDRTILDSFAKPVYAAENTNYVAPTVKRNVSADGGTYDANGNFTPYFPSNTTPKGSPTGDQSGGSSGTSQQDIINAYKAMGWTDVNAILADYAATGGSKMGGGSGGGEDFNAKLRGEIEGGYDSYINDLNNLYGGLTTQAGAQENIAQNSYGQSIKDLLANKESSLGDLGLTEQKLQANQVKNLRDIASNIQNQYMAGNVMLGARGAGDSSAANQYSYALNRLGSKERGNVMNTTAQSQQEIENQKAKLNNIVTQETSRLDTELANVKQGISSWLAEQQNAVSQMISQGKLNKSKEIASLTQNLLNQALSAYQTKQQEISGRKSALESWAMNNANNIKQLQANMGAIGQFAPNMAQARTLNGSVTTDAQGNIRGLYGYGTSDEDKNNYFG